MWEWGPAFAVRGAGVGIDGQAVVNLHGDELQSGPPPEEYGACGAVPRAAVKRATLRVA